MSTRNCNHNTSIIMQILLLIIYIGLVQTYFYRVILNSSFMYLHIYIMFIFMHVCLHEFLNYNNSISYKLLVTWLKCLFLFVLVFFYFLVVFSIEIDIFNRIDIASLTIQSLYLSSQLPRTFFGNMLTTLARKADRPEN